MFDSSLFDCAIFDCADAPLKQYAVMIKVSVKERVKSVFNVRPI